MFFNTIVKLVKLNSNKCTLNPLSAVMRHRGFFPLFNARVPLNRKFINRSPENFMNSFDGVCRGKPQGTDLAAWGGGVFFVAGNING